MSLKDSFNLYLKYIKFEKNLAENTISSYRKDIGHFLSYITKFAEKKIINLSSFRGYMKYISKFNYSNSTLIRKYSSLSGYFKFLEINNYIKYPLSQFIMSPKKRTALYTFLSQSEMSAFLEKTDTSGPSGIRNRAIIEFLYSTGARVSEAESLKMSDLNLEKQEATVFGKGRKYRTVYLGSDAVEWLERYLSVRKEIISGSKTSQGKMGKLKSGGLQTSCDSVFINKFGRKLSQRSIRNIIKQSLKFSGIDKKISPHKIRHTFATHLLQEGAGIREIQMLLGHSSISTTQIYTHLNIKKLKKDFEKYHPRAK